MRIVRQSLLGPITIAALIAGCGGAQAPSADATASASASEKATPSPSASAAEAASSEEDQVAAAEAFVDAFYAFDPDPLAEMLSDAGASGPEILAYQGWAEGAHYTVLERHGCEVIDLNVVECPVTVEDDLLLSLGSDFKVTDVFRLTFEGSDIVSVATGSDDPEVVRQAFNWVFTTYPELFDEACKGFDTGVAETPGDCARAVVAGFVEFAESEDFPGAP